MRCGGLGREILLFQPNLVNLMVVGSLPTPRKRVKHMILSMIDNDIQSFEAKKVHNNGKTKKKHFGGISKFGHNILPQ